MNLEKHALLYEITSIVFGISVFLGLLGWLIAFVSQFEMSYLKFKKIGLILIFNAIFWGFATLGIYTKLYNKIRNEIATLMKDPATEIYQEDFTYGKLSSTELKTEIKKINDHNPGHSNYEKCMLLTVINKKTKTFHLTICKDTQRDHIYWIFTDKYDFINHRTEIGRISSEILK